MRFRTDSWYIADKKAAGMEHHAWICELEQWNETPKAEPGDVWRIHWHGGPIAGYAICCIGCRRVHAWTTALNCAQRFQQFHKDSEGKDIPYWTCPHQGTGSCWNWSGSAEEGTLTASPSLKVEPIGESPCDWHGYIQNGDIHT